MERPKQLRKINRTARSPEEPCAGAAAKRRQTAQSAARRENGSESKPHAGICGGAPGNRCPYLNANGMKSSVSYYFLIKIGCAVLICFLIRALLVALFSSDAAQDQVPEWTTMEKIESWVILPGALFVFGYCAWNFGVVDCRHNEIEVRKNRRRRVIGWNQVSSIYQMPFCTPPVYRIAFKNGDSPVFVIVFSWRLLSIGFWSWDFTGFRNYVQLQIDDCSE